MNALEQKINDSLQRVLNHHLMINRAIKNHTVPFLQIKLMPETIEKLILKVHTWSK